MAQVIQNSANATTDPAAWSTQIVGTLGRIVERDDWRWMQVGNCQWQASADVTTFTFDRPYGGNAARYGTTDASLASAMNAWSTLSFGYDAQHMPKLRDEWTVDNKLHSVAESYGVDGRLLQRSVTSPSLAAYNGISTVGYAVGYDSAGRPSQVSSTYDASGAYRAISAAGASTALWLAGTGSTSTDPAAGPYDALNRLAAEKWDSGAVAKSRSFLAGSNLLASDATSASNAGVTNNVYTAQMTSWQGRLSTGYTITSAWEGAGSSYGAAYDVDGHLKAWNAAAVGQVGSATQQFSEGYTFSLENFQQISSTNSLGRTTTATYNYGDSTSKERVTSILVPNVPVGDYFTYDRRGRGLIATHSLSSTQTPPQDSYQYDVQDRLISISHLGAKVEDLSYDAAGQLVGRAFPSGPDSARYYIGHDLTVVAGSSLSSRTIGYVHVRLGARRIASIWAKSASGVSTNGSIYYHRDARSSVMATTTAGGSTGISYRYLPSGAVDKTIGTEADETASELGFTGGLKLSGGLIHLRARVYSPLLRRFLQPDTIDLRRYTYANGDPMNVVDSTGRSGESPNNAPGPVGSTTWDMLDEKLDKASFSMAGHVSIDADSISTISATTTTTTTMKTEARGFNENGSVAWSTTTYKTTVQTSCSSGSLLGFLRGGPGVVSTGESSGRGGYLQMQSSRTPAKGAPGTSINLPGDKPGQKTIRIFGDDGRAVKDIDFGHNHGAGDPHAHDWDWTSDTPRGPGRPLEPGENPDGPPIIDPDAAARAAEWATAGTVLYWIVSESSRVLFPPRNLVPLP
jgi:RHS repeat-associated protein